MIKSILAYGITIAVSIASFSTLVQSDNSINNYSKQHDTYAMTGADRNNDASISLQQAIDLILAQRGGRIIEAEHEQKRDEKLYEIKGIDAEGKRYKVYLTAATGKILEKHDDD